MLTFFLNLWGESQVQEFGNESEWIWAFQIISSLGIWAEKCFMAGTHCMASIVFSISLPVQTSYSKFQYGNVWNRFGRAFFDFGRNCFSSRLFQTPWLSKNMEFWQNFDQKYDAIMHIASHSLTQKIFTSTKKSTMKKWLTKKQRHLLNAFLFFSVSLSATCMICMKSTYWMKQYFFHGGHYCMSWWIMGIHW